MQTYGDFLEESYRALRASAPFLTYGRAWTRWLRQIGELLAGLDPATQHEWVEQYATLIVIKYGNVLPVFAQMYVRSAIVEASVLREVRS